MTSPNPVVVVASYNIRYAGLDEGVLAWPVRCDQIAAIIREAAPDLLAVQECWLNQLADLRERLAEYDWVGERDASGEHTPIAYRSDRFSPIETVVVGIAPHGKRGVAAWDATYPRTLTTAVFRDMQTDATVGVCSIHLDHEGATARLKGAQFVCNRAPKPPIVVAGDMNCLPGSPPHTAFTDAGFTDAAMEATDEAETTPTYTGFPGETVDARRIDYLFVDGGSVRDYWVVGAPDNAPASDHRLIAATFSLGESVE